MWRRFILAANTCLALSGCASTTATTSEGPARLRQTVHVDGPRVTPLRVIEDSRCPMSAQCVWAGRVVLRVKVQGGAWQRELDLALGEPVPVADGTLTLTAVPPDRRADQPIGPSDYRFAFVFAGGL